MKKVFNILHYLIIFLLLFNPIIMSNVQGVTSEHFFTLTLKMRNLDAFTDMAILFSQQLRQIGIDLDAQLLSWSEYVQELLEYRDYDIFHLSLTGGGDDPVSYSQLYEEEGEYNFFNYDSSIDYNTSLAEGMNQWFLDEGEKLFPPISQDRIDHYWSWQKHLSEKIHPLAGVYTALNYRSYWSTLKNYDFVNDLILNWGKMYWQTSHPNQSSLNELVLSQTDSWGNLNPLFYGGSDKFPATLSLEPLIWIDGDKSIYPHLAREIEHLNATHIRVYLREGVQWQPDPDDNFTNELFDAHDVYFSYYCWQHLASDNSSFSWIEDMNIINNYTIDFYIDNDPLSPGQQYTPTYLSSLSALILPEHYLNQTQLADGITPDCSHSSWVKYNNNCFGTGLFVLDNIVPDSEVQFILNPNSWLLNDSFDKSNMDFATRFGTNWSLNKLRIKILSGYTIALQQFMWGHIDVLDVTGRAENRTTLLATGNFVIQEKYRNSLTMFGFNLKSTRPWIGNTNPCPEDPSLTIGLAIRTAISYALNRTELITFLDEIEYGIHDYPISPTMGIWLNPNLIHYDFDLEKAKFYMEKAGYHYSTSPTGRISLRLNVLVFVLIIQTSLVFIYNKRKRVKNHSYINYS